MKREQTKAAELLRRFLEEFGEPPRDSMEKTRERLLTNFRSDAMVATELQGFDMKHDLARRRRPAILWVAAAVFSFVAGFLTWLQIPRASSHAAAVVQVADKALSVISGEGRRPLNINDAIRFGDTVRASSGASIKLADTSRVELRSETEFALERAADGVRIHLFKGGLIINAAKRTAGHLYVQTKDVIVSVVGTVFFVNAEEEGSRVAVLEGEVRVQQGATTKNLLPGEQLATNPKMEPLSVREGLAWSHTVEIAAALRQQPAPVSAPKRLEFEVASLRPVEEGRPTDIRCRGIDGSWSANFQNAEANAAPIPLGRCIGAFSLKQFVVLGTGFPQQRTSGIQLGMFEDVYQLEGKAEDPTTTTKAQLQEMIQSLVIDRFKLRTHIEMREQEGYSLNIAAGGVKFKQTQDNEELTKRPPACGTCFDGKFTLKRFANGLEFAPIFIGGPVVDKTGLKGVYEIKLNIERVQDLFGGGRGERGGLGGGPPARPEFDPPLAKALEQQLGLRLEAGKVQVEHLVVDHWERSTDN